MQSVVYHFVVIFSSFKKTETASDVGVMARIHVAGI